MKRRGLTAFALLVALVSAVLVAPAAWATDPGPLDGPGRITDISDVLSEAETAAAEERLTALEADTGVDLFFAFVPQFTGAADDVDWVEQTAQRNAFNTRQYVVGIATDGRAFAIAGRERGGPLSESDQEKVTGAMLPALRVDDWAGAIDAAAAEVQDIVVDAPARTARGWSLAGIIALLVAAAVVVVVLVRRARRRAAEQERRRAALAQTAQQAGVALVRTDDLVRTSEQEMEYARAQFGDDVIGPFVQALRTSRENLDEAFSLQQKLDDEIPDTDQQKQEWYERILQLCSQSTTVLEERKTEFDVLRRLEQNAPSVLASLRSRREEAAAATERADGILAELIRTYAPGAVSPVTENVEQARSRLTFADARLAEADEAMRADRSGDAAVALRAAEASVQQAAQLADAVQRLQQDLHTSAERARALISELSGDVQTAQMLPDPQGAVAQAVDATRGGIGQAQGLLTADASDPLTALRVLEAANASIDGAIAAGRDEQERIARARGMLTDALERARIQIAHAEDYIRTHRGAVGSVPRTRLAEASRALSDAHRLAVDEPVQALGSAQQADRMAAEALRQAQSDTGGWGGSGGGDDALGALLGGILIGQATGRRGGGFGGGGFSVGGFGGGFGGGGGGGFSGSSGGRF